MLCLLKLVHFLYGPDYTPAVLVVVCIRKWPQDLKKPELYRPPDTTVLTKFDLATKFEDATRANQHFLARNHKALFSHNHNRTVKAIHLKTADVPIPELERKSSDEAGSSGVEKSIASLSSGMSAVKVEDCEIDMEGARENEKRRGLIVSNMRLAEV